MVNNNQFLSSNIVMNVIVTFQMQWAPVLVVQKNLGRLQLEVDLDSEHKIFR